MIRAIALKFLAVLLLNLSLSAQAMAQDNNTGLDSRLASEVRIDMWANGIDDNYKSSYQMYQDMLEADMSQSKPSENTTVAEVADLPEELEIALFSFN